MSDKQLVLHIGFPKAGTTAIQHWLRRNADLLSQQGIFYPDTGRFFHHNLARGFLNQAAFVPSAKQSESHQPDFESNALALTELEQLLSDFKRSDEHHLLLISSEAFTWHWRYVDFALLRKLCSGMQIRILAYVRPQADYIEASYREQIQGFENRSSQTFEEYLQSYDYESADYQQILAKWSTHLGDTPLHVRLYDRDRFKDGDIRRDFIEFADLPKVCNEWPSPQSKGNQGVHLLSLEIMRLANAIRATRSRAGVDRLKRVLEPYDRRMQAKYGTLSLLTRLQCDEIAVRYSQANQVVGLKYLQESAALEISSASGRLNILGQKGLRKKALVELFRHLLNRTPV